MIGRIAIAAALVASLAAEAEAEARTVSYAIIIGNNAPPIGDTDEQLGPLRYADDDAVRYHQLLGRLGRATLLSVLDGPTQRRYPQLAAATRAPTLANLRAAVARYAQAMARDRARGDRSVLYFVFTGHGARGQIGAFLSMLDGPLTREVLYDEVLARLPATYSHVIVDACNAGGVVGVRGGFFDDEVEGKTVEVSEADIAAVVGSRRIARFPGVGVLVATSAGQQAHEWSAIESGVFSHELLSGLAGPADINGDGAVEYSEIQAFVAAANRDIRDPRAVPRIIARPPRINHNAPLIRLPALARSRVLRGDLGKLGRFFVELDDGQRYLDAHLAAGTETTVVLPVSRLAYLRTETHEALIPSGQRVTVDQLRLVRRRDTARGSIERSYRTRLFASAYSRSYYEGFVDSVGAAGVRFAPRPLEIRRPAARASGSKPLAVGAASLAAIAGVAAVGSAALALDARGDFQATDLQRPALEARRRYDRYRVVALAAGVTAIAAGVATWWWWPRSAPAIIPSASPRGDVALSLELPW